MSNLYPPDSYNPYQDSSYGEPRYQEVPYQPPLSQPLPYQELANQEPLYQPPSSPQPWGPVPYVAPQIIIMKPPTNGKATASMVLGLFVVLTFCSFSGFAPIAFLAGLGTGIPAVILGHKALKEIRNSNGMQGGKEMAIAGLVLGYISIGLALVAGVITLVLVALFLQAGAP
jgi:hypothetical protein